MQDDAVDGSAAPWEEHTSFLLWRAQSAVHRRVQEVLEDVGVNVTQLGLAMHLSELGALSASDLSRRYRITPQSVTTALGHLERIGWVTRRPHPVHKRIVLYDLTPEGRAGMQRGRARMEELTAEVNSALADPSGGRLADELRRIVLAIDGPEPPLGPIWPVA